MHAGGIATCVYYLGRQGVCSVEFLDDVSNELMS